MKKTKERDLESWGPAAGDKRPIAKFHRCWLEDLANGVAVERCRGINQAQFRAADRLAVNYQKATGCKSSSVAIVQTNRRLQAGAGFEQQVIALREHQLVFARLGRKSQEIVQHFCLDELPLREFELAQIPQWCKGVAGARLREALDELVEIYRQYHQNKLSK